MASQAITSGGLQTLTSQRGEVQIVLDERTGLPAAFAAPADAKAVPLAFTIELEAGGDEVPDTMGGLTYRNTERYEAHRLIPGSVEHVTAGPEETYSAELDAGAWRVRLRVTLRREHPRVELRVAATPAGPTEEAALRDLHLKTELRPDDLGDWSVEAPGNTLRPGVSAASIPEPTTVLTAGHELGSPGLVAFHDDAQPVTLVVWPFSRSEQGQMTLEPAGTGLELHLRTQLAGAVKPGEWLEHGPIYLDVLDREWQDVRERLNGWYGSMGLFAPVERPGWARAVSLFEVMVGSAPFRGGYQYCPYPTLRDLIADLDRIAELGFGCLQLMPRHPYPSYNIHAPGDVATTYGDPEELRELVEECHARGMRLILDILLHGVVDKSVMRRTVELVEQGPYGDRLEDPCSDPYDFASVEISWSRHILEFAPHWIDGAPERHPLLDAHPEWFMRDSQGAVTGIYTHALDIANDAWQDHFVGTCEAIVREFGIDGFRVDAPLYNRFANWSATTRRHASYSSMGALRLLRKLRRRLRGVSDDLLVYSEPCGALHRESLDLNYGYEELWLIPSLFEVDGDGDNDWRRVRTGRELTEWFRDFDAALPERSVSAHFVDCHDTMWWRLPGDHWVREQIGLEATRAMVAIWGLRGGAYLTFVGGEEGLEGELRLLHSLRAHLPEIRDGRASYNLVSSGDDAVYVVLRHTPDRAAIVAVNTSDTNLRCVLNARPPGRTLAVGEQVLDLWTGERLRAPTVADGTMRFELDFAPYQARVLALSDPPDELSRPRQP